MQVKKICTKDTVGGTVDGSTTATSTDSFVSESVRYVNQLIDHCIFYEV